jgi:hypothetical protein
MVVADILDASGLHGRNQRIDSMAILSLLVFLEFIIFIS